MIEPRELYVGYARDESIRVRASSGGIVSCVLIDLLEKGEIDGALVSRITSQHGTIAGVTNVARTRSEILQHSGSSYIDTPVVQKVRDLRTYPGRLAVVALPCQVRAIRAIMNREPNLRERFFPLVSLFCRGAVKPAFYDDYLRRRGIDLGQVESVRVVRARVTGDVLVSFKEGAEVRIPFLHMNAYRVVGIHAKRLCAWCDEHLGTQADISVGDIFTREFKKREIKHSAFVPWTERASQVLESMRQRNRLTSEYFGIDNYRRVFAKVEQFSASLASRHTAARILGLRRPQNPTGRFSPFHCLAWLIILASSRLSEQAWGRRLLYALPEKLMLLVAFFVKGCSRL